MMESLTQTVINLWNGNVPLWSAFWVWGQGVYALVLAAYLGMYKLSFEMLAPFRARFAEDTGLVAQALRLLGIVVNMADLLGLVVITGFFTVVIWRAAPNADWIGWTYAARAYMVVFWMFVGLGALWLWQNRGV
ncbi:MAG: hypothetical protein H6922_00945 [Pseudomonadaceae bacterium]|nr:hypothetical protein [Pseudomonadaceae bacterium]